MNADVWYLDSSASVKTVLRETESEALLTWLEDKARFVACELARVEVVRSVAASDPAALPRARAALAALTLLRLDDSLYARAADLDPPLLRSIDAIHLAAALIVGRELAGVATYDARMADGARVAGGRTTLRPELCAIGVRVAARD
ncbi:MAG: PIN domain-containing protein [Actinobacteria bacterium]|nr:PIN domain-containing protein [Actinomycetota bacterium]